MTPKEYLFFLEQYREELINDIFSTTAFNSNYMGKHEYVEKLIKRITEFNELVLEYKITEKKIKSVEEDLGREQKI